MASNSNTAALVTVTDFFEIPWSLECLCFGTGQGYNSQPVDKSGYQQYGTSPGYGSRNDYGKTPAEKDRFVVLVSEAPCRPDDFVNLLFI